MDNGTLESEMSLEILGDNRTNLTEPLEHLNARYAEALLPLTVTFGVFTFLGCTGNLVILLVFFLSREYRRNFKIFVLTLGVIDFLTCITLIPAEMVKQRHYFSFGDAVSCKIKCFFNVFGASASCLAFLVISVDRFRKVVQPMRKQLSPKAAIMILFVVAGVFPVVLAIPSAIMCGIEIAKKKNIYGTYTNVFICATEEEYRYSTLRVAYKYVFILLLAVISFAYMVLYSFVMREVIKQIRYIAQQRKNSSFEVVFSSDVYEPNSIHGHIDDVCITSPQNYTRVSDGNIQPLVRNGSTQISIKEPDLKKTSRQPSARSLRSIKSRLPFVQRHQFPSKTLIWFILTLIFIITYVTHIVLSLRVEEVLTMSPYEFSDYSFFFRIYFFNHMINPVVYAIFVKRFRRSCVKLIPNIKKRFVDACT